MASIHPPGEAAVRETGAQARRSVSLRALAALGVAVIAALVFLEIAELVRHGQATELDRAISLRVHELDSDRMDTVMRLFTFLGQIATIVTVAAAVAMVLLWQRARTLCILLVSIVASAILLNTLLKTHFQRARPDLFFEIVAPLSYSFPSGHALISTAAYGAMAIVAARLVPGLRWPIYAATTAMVFCIGVSRIYLGVHWPSDVAAGFVAGGFLLIAFEYAASRVREPALVRGAQI